MSSLTWQERCNVMTSADVMQWLDVEHCSFCAAMGTGLQAWWSDPNSVQGRAQLDDIGTHFLNHRIGATHE